MKHQEEAMNRSSWTLKSKLASNQFPRTWRKNWWSAGTWRWKIWWSWTSPGSRRIIPLKLMKALRSRSDQFLTVTTSMRLSNSSHVIIGLEQVDVRGHGTTSHLGIGIPLRYFDGSGSVSTRAGKDWGWAARGWKLESMLQSMSEGWCVEAESGCEVQFSHSIVSAVDVEPVVVVFSSLEFAIGPIGLYLLKPWTTITIKLTTEFDQSLLDGLCQLECAGYTSRTTLISCLVPLLQSFWTVRIVSYYYLGSVFVEVRRNVKLTGSKYDIHAVEGDTNLSTQIDSINRYTCT